MQRWAEESGERHRTQRRNLGFDQTDVADLAGVANTTVSKIELGLVIPKESVRHALACALLCEVEDIWPPLRRSYVMAVAGAEVAA